MLSKLKIIAKKVPGVQSLYTKKKFENYHFNDIEQLRFKFVDTDEKHINLIIPTLNSKDVFAGIATAVNFFTNLSDYMGIKKRIICMNDSLEKNDIYNSNVFKYADTIKLDDDNVVIDNTKRDKEILVGENDIFLVTFWTTAYAIEKLANSFSEKFNKPLNMIYLIQDYEPGFYKWSTEYLLSESTYRMNTNTIAVFNSFLLRDYFKELGYNFPYEFAFTPKLNKNLKEILLKNKNHTQRKNQILIYGRPGTSRNAFTLILMALENWYTSDPEASKWSVYSAGEAFPKIKNKSGLEIKSLGKLSLEEYAQFMLETKVGISLMVSPHPSYPPLEMSTFGIKVITNNFLNKDLSKVNKNIISLECCNIQNLSNAISDVIRKSEENKVIINDYLDDDMDQWDSIYKDITEIFSSETVK